MTEWIQPLLQLGIPLLLLATGFFIGSAVESSHYRSIRIRETRTRRQPVVTLPEAPAHWRIEAAELVAGSTVVSLDYFKRFLAGLRALVGGRVKSYESLLDRARREALLRMREQALGLGYNAVINVRLETSRLASSSRDGKGTAGVEVLAFGTGVKYSS